MNIKSYRMLRNSKLEPQAKAGTTVYACSKYDYGLANDDTRVTGKEHISVTLKPDGDWPSFTVAVEDLEEVK